MASFIVYISFVWIYIYGTQCQKSCIITNLKGLDVSCNVTALHATNITWSLLDTETNKTVIINICESNLCHPLIPRLANCLLLAKVTSDEYGQYIQTTTLKADIKYANLTKLSSFQQLQCRYNDQIVTVCDTIDVHVIPTKIFFMESFISRTGDTFLIYVKTDDVFPKPKFTLYLDNATVENNSPLLTEFEEGLAFKKSITNPDSDSNFEYVHTYEGSVVYELNVTKLGQGTHTIEVTASDKASDKEQYLLTTGSLSINFNLSDEVVPVCYYTDFLLNSVSLTCRSEVVRYLAGCQFEILTNGSSHRILSFIKGVKQKYADLLGVPKLVAECSMTLSTVLMEPGYEQLRLSLVTNDTNGILKNFTSSYMTPFNLSDVSVPGCSYQEVSDQIVTVVCRMNETEDFVGCAYQIKTNGDFTNVKGNTTLDKLFSKGLNGESINISQCTLKVNPTDLGIGYHQFSITFLARATNGNLTRKNLGFTSLLYFYLPVVESQSNINMFSSDEVGKWDCILKVRGNPPGSVRWTWVAKNGTLFMGEPGSNELTYGYQALVDNTNFSCEPLSVLKPNLPMLPVSLVVKRKQALLNFTANGKENNLVVDIGSYITLECLASGYPVPGITFGHEGTNLSVTTKSPYYTFKVISCLDAGRYVCTVKQWNDYKSLETTVDIFVKCPQKIVNPVSNPREYTSQLRGHLEINIPVSGYPEPNHYTLLRQSGNKTVIVTDGYKARFQRGEYVDGIVVLEFTDIREEIFTNLTFVFGNGMGTDQEYSFYLTKIEEPGGSDTNVGAIVGGVCGGVAGVVLIIGVIYFLNRRQKKNMQQTSSSNKYVMSAKGNA